MFDHRPKTSLGSSKRFYRVTSVRHVTVDDHKFFGGTFPRKNQTGRRLDDSPRTVFVAHPILDHVSTAGAPRFFGGAPYQLHVVRMYLSESRALSEFFR